MSRFSAAAIFAAYDAGGHHASSFQAFCFSVHAGLQLAGLHRELEPSGETDPSATGLPRVVATPGEMTTRTAARAIAAAAPGAPVVMVHNDREVLVRYDDTPEGVHRSWNATSETPVVSETDPNEHRLIGPQHRPECTCGSWKAPLGTNSTRAFDQHLVYVRGPWVDRHGDVWSLGDDGLLHSYETAPFPRERVEKKWGPLLPIGAVTRLSESQAVALAAIDLGIDPLPWQLNFVTRLLSGQPAALQLGAGTGKTTALRLAARADHYYRGGPTS